MSIQRYDPTPGGTDGFVEKMNEVPDGGWIKHTDHIAALEASDAVWRNSVVDMHDRAMTAEAALEAVQATVKPVAYLYRWKLDGEWTNWRVSDASQKSPHLKDLEERPLYASQLIKTVETDQHQTLADALDPMRTPDGAWRDQLLLDIHADIETRGRKDASFAVSVHHRNIVLNAVAVALRSAIVPSPALEANQQSADEAWEELCGKDDRTSPEEYPDMCLITRDELAEFMRQTEVNKQPIAWRWRDTEHQTWNYIDFDPVHMDYVFVEPLYSDALEANQQAEPIMYVSEQQLGSVGEYLPTRAKPEGNFQFALYAAPSSALEANQQVIETLRAALERICDYANADYVPNVLFDKARAALLFAALTHTQPEPTRGQSNAEL